MKESQVSLKLLDDSTINISERSETVEKYLVLVRRTKELDDAIQLSRKEYKAARLDFEEISAQLREALWIQKGYKILWHQPENEEHLHPHLKVDPLVDPQAVAKQIVEHEDTAIRVAAAVGTFGAGITYGTLMGTARGRLDIICGAFACFISVLFNCMWAQMEGPEKRMQGHIRRWKRSTDRPSDWQLWAEPDPTVVISLFGGFILLALSLVLMDGSTHAEDPDTYTMVRSVGGILFVTLIPLTRVVGAIVGFLGVVANGLSWRRMPTPTETV